MIFITSRTDHLEKTGSLSYADFLNVHTFYYAIQKVTFANGITIHLMRSVFKDRKLASSWLYKEVFQNSHFPSRAQIFHWQQTLPIVFLKVMSLLGSFFKKRLPSICQLTSTSLAVVLPGKTGAPNHGPYRISEFRWQPGWVSAFSQGNHQHRVGSERALRGLPRGTQNIKKLGQN